MIHQARPTSRRALAAAVGLAAAAMSVGSVAAHGSAPDGPPTAASLLLGWTFPPLPTLAIVAALAWWRWAVGRVDAAHPIVSHWHYDPEVMDAYHAHCATPQGITMSSRMKVVEAQPVEIDESYVLACAGITDEENHDRPNQLHPRDR